MTVVLSGGSLTIDEVVRVARRRERVEIAASAVERMREARAIVESALAGEAPVYGVTTGLGTRKEVVVSTDDLAAFNLATISAHRVGLGPPAREDVVRAMLVRLANGLAAGFQGARPELAQLAVDTLNGGVLPEVRMLGTLGQADLAQNADLAHGLLRGHPLQAGEAVALLSTNAFSTGHAALAVADLRLLLDAADAAAALALEAFRANLESLHPVVAQARPYPGIAETLKSLQRLLEGSALWQPGAARNLQDPLTFRCIPQVHGAARDALRFGEEQLAIELNGHQGNPLVAPAERRLVSVGNFDSLPLAAALDLLRIALAPVLTGAAERASKLLSSRFSGLPDGLAEHGGTWEDGLAELGIAAQAVASEARLLAQPVSFELSSTSQESGLEDRTSLSSLGARRLAEMVELGARVVAIELAVAAQAIDLREKVKLGTGVAAAHGLVRRHVPLLRAGDPMPIPLEPLAGAVGAGLRVTAEES